MSRGFAWIEGYENGTRRLPHRKTAYSAGYDLEAAERTLLPTGKTVLVATGLKAFMKPDEVLFLMIRSSKAIKKQLVLANSVGVIDADYYNNPTNDGHILLAISNLGTEDVVIEEGEAIAQGIFSRYLISSEDEMPEQRVGGLGSTDKLSTK